MSKKYNGKLCVYCAKNKNTQTEHVFAREFFHVDDRRDLDLPKVPACSTCNGEKSRLEHYALSVLPFGGRHAAARANLETRVPKRLEANAPLARDLFQGIGRTWVKNSSGLVLPRMTFPLDIDRLKPLFVFVAK